MSIQWARQLSRYSDWLRDGRSGDRIPVGARFSAPVQTGPGAHPASCTMDTGSLPRVKSGRGVTLTPHFLLVPWSRKGKAIPLLPLWAVRPVQSLTACTRAIFTFTFLPQRKNVLWHSLRHTELVLTTPSTHKSTPPYSIPYVAFNELYVGLKKKTEKGWLNTAINKSA